MADLGSHGGFTPDRNLLNPKFDTYLLHALDQNALVSSHPLPVPIAAPAVPNSVYLPFHDVEYRIRHNHLVSALGGRLVYISASFDVVVIHLDPASGIPTFSKIITLPPPVALPPPLYAEYPAVRTIGGNVLAVSDGAGQIHVVEAQDPHGPESGILLATYRLSTGEEDDIVPFRLHHVRLHEDSVHCIISVSTRITTPAPSSSHQKTHEKTSYRLMSVSFKLFKHPHPGVQLLTVDWALTGDSLPLLFLHDPDAQRYIVASATPFGVLPSHADLQDPQPDEIAPIPRPNENLNAVTPIRDAKPPPYSWTQTYDSVTVVFPLPATTPKSSIRVLFAEKNLTLLVSDRDKTSPIPLPVYVRKPFWDSIHADTSYWTWDAEGDKPGSAFGLLSLHLDKMHEDVRWTHVFATTGTADAGEEDVEVPETVDPSELANIREQLEKWTSELASDPTGAGGLGRGVPSLLDGEMDEEVDEQVGSRVVFTYVSEAGEAICPAPLSPVDLLSVPFPNTVPSAVTKYTLDGLFFTAPSSPSPDTPSYTWHHTSTYPALAFVLASKRDVKFTYHHGPSLVFAFEGGTGKGLSIGGNVYMYRGAEGRRHAAQAVLRVSGGEEGPLMGVQLLEGQVGGRGVLVCLCERGVVVVRDVLGWP